MTTLVIGLLIFFTAHTFTIFRDVRERAVTRLGALPYRGVYTLVSLLGFALIVIGYGDAPRIELWSPPPWMRHVTMVLMLPVFVLLVAAFVPGNIKARVKNPMLIAVKTWAFAHLLVNADVASILLFGAFLLWAVADLIAVKRSDRGAKVAAPKAVYDAIAVAAGLVVYALIVKILHVYIAGVALAL